MIWLQLGLVLALVAGGAMAVHRYSSAIEERDLAEQRARKAETLAADQAAAIGKLQEMGRLSDRLTRRAKADAEQERRRADAVEDELGKLAKGEPSVAEWLATSVPASVRGMRRAGSDGAGARGVLGPGGEAGANTGAKDAR